MTRSVVSQVLLLFHQLFECRGWEKGIPVRSLTDVLLVSQDLDPDKGQDMIGGECMAVGVPWLEFQSGLGSGVQDPGVDVGKGKDNERGNADGKRLAGSET